MEELLTVPSDRPSAAGTRLTGPIVIRPMSHVRRPPIVRGRPHCFQYDCPPGIALLLKVSIVIIISSHYTLRFMGSCNFVRAALILGLPGTWILSLSFSLPLFLSLLGHSLMYDAISLVASREIRDYFDTKVKIIRISGKDFQDSSLWRDEKSSYVTTRILVSSKFKTALLKLSVGKVNAWSDII